MTPDERLSIELEALEGAAPIAAPPRLSARRPGWVRVAAVAAPVVVVAVLVGSLPFIERRPTGTAGPQPSGTALPEAAEIRSGDFVLRITAPRAQWAADEPIQISASLTYDGPLDQLELWASRSGPIHFAVFELDGDRVMAGGSTSECARHSIAQGAPLVKPYAKSGGVSGEDPHDAFYREFLADPQFHLPRGRWEVIAYAAFAVGDCHGERATMEVSLVLEIEDAPPATPTATPFPPGPFGLGWSTAGALEGLVNDVIHDSLLQRWIVIGKDQEIWTSADVERFEAANVEQGVSRCETPGQCNFAMTSVARHGDWLYAIGHLDDSIDNLYVEVWRSANGTDWEHLRQPQLTYCIAGGAASNGEVIAVAAGFYAGGAVLTTPDGLTWAEHQPGGTARMYDVYGDADGFVAVGARNDQDSAAPYMEDQPVIWHSADGERWVEAASLPRSRGILTDITRGPSGRYAAVGAARDGRLIVWHSADGLSWDEETLAGPADDSVPFTNFDALALASGDIGFVVADGYRPEMWTSADGIEWSAIPGPSPTGETSFGPEYQLAVEADMVLAFFSRQYTEDPATRTSMQWKGRREPIE